MTPAITLLQKKSIAHQVHEYQHDPSHPSFGLEAAEKMQVEAERVFKTLVVKLDSHCLVVAIVPVEAKLSLKAIAKAAGGKKAMMADKNEVERSTGYVLGGVSPLAQKKRLKTVIDSSAKVFESIFVSGGKRGLELQLHASDLARVVGATFAQIVQIDR